MQERNTCLGSHLMHMTIRQTLAVGRYVVVCPRCYEQAESWWRRQGRSLTQADTTVKESTCFLKCTNMSDVRLQSESACRLICSTSLPDSRQITGWDWICDHDFDCASVVHVF